MINFVCFEQKFREIMRELQGAIIVGSLFQCILGSTGLMSLLLRLILQSLKKQQQFLRIIIVLLIICFFLQIY